MRAPWWGVAEGSMQSIVLPYLAVVGVRSCDVHRSAPTCEPNITACLTAKRTVPSVAVRRQLLSGDFTQAVRAIVKSAPLSMRTSSFSLSGLRVTQPWL